MPVNQVSSSPESSLERVCGEFEQWRKTRKAGERIPESLWEEAVGLTEHYSINQVSRWLHLSYADLKHRVEHPKEPASPEFIRVDPAQVFGFGQCIVEMHQPDGRRIVFRGLSGSEAIELGKALWRGGP
jgi:hypothetical protein